MSQIDPLVLVIEDEPQMRRFIRASMTAHGYQVAEAATGAEAIALATSTPPEVILLDLGLPDGDGIDLTRRFREWSRVPIIVISARGREDPIITQKPDVAAPPLAVFRSAACP